MGGGRGLMLSSLDVTIYCIDIILNTQMAQMAGILRAKAPSTINKKPNTLIIKKPAI